MYAKLANLFRALMTRLGDLPAKTLSNVTNSSILENPQIVINSVIGGFS